MSGSDSRDLAEEYPGVDLAYPLALASYEWAQKRFDAANDRAQKLVAFATTITLALPVLATSIKSPLNFHSGWFIAAICIYLLGVVLGVFASLRGDLMIISPSLLYENWLGHSDWKFKKNAIYFAGQALDVNREIINRKGWLTRFSATAFLIEAACLLAWVSL